MMNIATQDNVSRAGIQPLSFDEIESVSGGFEFTGAGIAAGIGTFVGGLAGTYASAEAGTALGLVLGGPVGGVIGGAMGAAAGYVWYRVIEG